MLREPASLYLWCTNPGDLLNEPLAQACMTLLSEDERAHWRTFRFDHSRREYLATRALVRTALSNYHPIGSEAWRFRQNSYGKPMVDPDCGLLFNLSNSHELVICLISRGTEVGVDLEPYKHAEKIVEIAHEVFSPQEVAQLEALNESQKLDRALSLWTLKEAYIKARGVGLSLPLNQISFLFDGAEEIRLELAPSLRNQPERLWQFCLMDLKDHRIALMAESPAAPSLQFWEAHPLLAPPKQFDVGKQIWFSALAV
jgi:4'-phosphopantetheinyl transferase